jgi:hypothetical protein
MKKYVYVFHIDTPVAEVSEAAMAAWGKWFETLGDKVVDGGNPFNPNEVAQIKDGKVTMDPDTGCGYAIVNANDLKEAVTMAMSCPVATGDDSWVQVYETMPM